MNERLRSWVAVGELIAAAGVVVSLIFVGYELNSGNKIQQAANDNLLYELQDALYSDLSTDPVLSSAYMKLTGGEDELTPQELTQYGWYLWRQMNLWELAFDRHTDGLLSDSKWAAWRRAFESEVIDEATGMPKELWEIGRGTYGTEFVEYVDSAYEHVDN
jgi:hypothetical protein